MTQIAPSPLPPDMTTREIALYLAVLHHGLAASGHSTTRDSVPASKETVTRTADFFQAYLERED